MCMKILLSVLLNCHVQYPSCWDENSSNLPGCISHGIQSKYMGDFPADEDEWPSACGIGGAQSVPEYVYSHFDLLSFQY